MGPVIDTASRSPIISLTIHCCHFKKKKTDSPQLQQVKGKVSMKNNGAFARNNLIPFTVLKIIIVVVHCGGKQ